MDVLRVNDIHFKGIFHAGSFKPNRENTKVVNRLYHEVNGTNLQKDKSIRKFLFKKKYNLIYDNGINNDEITLVLEKANPKKHRLFQKIFIGNYTTENISNLSKDIKIRPLEEKLDKAGIFVVAGTITAMGLMLLTDFAAHTRHEIQRQFKNPKKTNSLYKTQTTLNSNIAKNTINLLGKIK